MEDNEEDQVYGLDPAPQRSRRDRRIRIDEPTPERTADLSYAVEQMRAALEALKKGNPQLTKTILSDTLKLPTMK